MRAYLFVGDSFPHSPAGSTDASEESYQRLERSIPGENLPMEYNIIYKYGDGSIPIDTFLVG